MKLLLWIAGLQGIYYLLSGLWPIVHMRSFEWVSGDKTDDWLVKTVGALIMVIGATLLWAAAHGRITDQTVFLALSAAGVLLWVDVVYVVKKIIPPIYLLDGIWEAALFAAWLYGLLK